MKISHLSLSEELELNDRYGCYKYEHIINIFTEIEHYLEKNNITKTDYLVWQCENSVKSAIAIIYFLTHQYSFLLIPIDSDIEIPKFCHYILKNFSIKTPDINWEIKSNANWNGKQAITDSPFLYVRTSGTTGKPKLIAHNHEKLWNNALNAGHRLGLTANDRISIPVPIYHLFGLGAGFLPSVLKGASVDLQNKANILTYLQREKSFNPNIAFMTPSFAQTLLKARKAERLYRFTVMAGDRILSDTFDRYEEKFGNIVTLYGSSEMGVMAIANSDESVEIRKNTVGKPLSGVEMKLEEGEVQQLLCLHQYAFTGYLDENGDWLSLIENDWFPTKDLAQIDDDGYLTILGRSDYCINRDGLLVLLTDIDKAIETITGVETAITVTTGESKRGKQLKSYCTLAKKSPLTDTEIRKACFDLLPLRAVPDEVTIVSRLPLLPNGKVDRQKLTIT